MLSGTEADIINCVARLRAATKGQIRNEVGFSLEYIGFVCRALIRGGFLVFSNGRYSLAKKGIKTLITEETPKIDIKLLKQVAGEIAKEISGELKKTVKGIKVPVRNIRERKVISREEPVKIKTDYELPIEDESLGLESNIDRVGAKLETETSDIDKSVELFRKIQKRRKR